LRIVHDGVLVPELTVLTDEAWFYTSGYNSTEHNRYNVLIIQSVPKREQHTSPLQMVNAAKGNNFCLQLNHTESINTKCSVTNY